VVSFLSAVFLWGLPLAGVPVVIHLLHRRQHHVLRWGAMQFLREATSRRHRFRRIDDLLLMLLRALAVAVLVLALARPAVRSAWFAPSGTRELVLLLDDSMSTARTLPEGAGTINEAIRHAAARLVGGLRPGDRVRVMAASSPRWLTDEPVTISGDPDAALTGPLDGLRPTLATADWLACAGGAIALPAAGLDLRERVVAVITDGRAHGWQPDATLSWMQLKQQADEAPCPTVLTVLDVTANDEADGAAGVPQINLSVDTVSSVRPVTGRGEPTPLTAVIRNTGSETSVPTPLHWLCGDHEMAVTTLEPIEPGQTVTVSVTHIFDEAGVLAVTCRIETADVLGPDNEGRFVVEVVESVPILVVDGSSRSDPLADQCQYILAALGDRRDEESDRRFGAFAPRVITPAELPAARLADFGAVLCLEDVRLTPTDLQRLADFVQNGGGLWVVAGPRTNAASFNASLYAGRGGLSPVTLGEPVGNANDHERFERICPPSADHPATALLADTNRLDIDRGRVYRRFPIAESSEKTDSSVLLATDAGVPLVVEKAFGHGRVLVQVVPMNAAWGNLPLCRAFVVMVHEWLWHLVAPSFSRWNLEPGQGLVIARATEGTFPAEHDAAVVTSPCGRTHQVEGRVEQDRLVYRFAQTFEPGPYVWVIPQTNDRNEQYPFEVRRDPNESDLAPLDDAQREALATAGDWHFVNDPLGRKWRIDDAPRNVPMGPSLLVGLLGLWAIELVLAGHLTRRRRAALAPLRREDTDVPEAAPQTAPVDRRWQHAPAHARGY